MQLLDELPGAVSAAIIDVEDVALARYLTPLDELLQEAREALSRISKDRLLVVARGDDHELGYDVSIHYLIA